VTFVSFVVKNDNAVVKYFNTDSPNMLQKGAAKKRGMSYEFLVVLPHFFNFLIARSPAVRDDAAISTLNARKEIYFA